MNSSFWDGFEKQAGVMKSLGRGLGYLKSIPKRISTPIANKTKAMGDAFKEGVNQTTRATDRKLGLREVSNKKTPEGIAGWWGRRSPATKGAIGGAAAGAGGVLGTQAYMAHRANKAQGYQNEQPAQYQ